MPELKDFAGAWRLSRRIRDFRAGAEGLFAGAATLTRDAEAEGWRWREEGEIRMGAAAPMRAAREYLWLAGAGEIRVHFADGRFFHAFRPGAGGAPAAHWCDPDDYRAEYDFSAWPVWTCRWRVRGPRKDYEMETECRRPE